MATLTLGYPIVARFRLFAPGLTRVLLPREGDNYGQGSLTQARYPMSFREVFDRLLFLLAVTGPAYPVSDMEDQRCRDGVPRVVYQTRYHLRVHLPTPGYTTLPYTTMSGTVTHGQEQAVHWAELPALGEGRPTLGRVALSRRRKTHSGLGSLVPGRRSPLWAG